MYFNKLKLAIVLFILCSNYAHAGIKIVGYLPTYRWNKLEQLDFKHLSHVCAAFANPDESGNMYIEQDLNYFVDICHKNNTKAMVSICGGGEYSWGEKYTIYEQLIETPKSRTKFISKIMKFMLENKLDGLDNDMEGKALKLANYNVFSQELADSLHAHNLEFSAALGVGGQWGVDLLTKETIQKYDFIMTMSYGGVGEWNWEQKPDEASFLQYQKDINYLIKLGMQKEKAIGGIPFYYVEYPSNQQENYHLFNKSICDLYNTQPNTLTQKQDTIKLANGNIIYQNTTATYLKKVDVAIQNNSGLMIWELGQDCFDEKSIFQIIVEYLDKKGVQIEKMTPKKR